MLKVSLVFILLCGLFTSLGAQQILDEVTQRHISAKFLAAMSSSNLQGWINTAFYSNFKPQGLLGGLLTSAKGNVQIQVKNPRLFEVSLVINASSNEAYLRIPLFFCLVFQPHFFNPFTFHMKTDIEVQLNLEKGLEDRYRLVFGSCQLLSQFMQIQPENLSPLLPDLAIKALERSLRITLTHNLGEVMCPLIDGALSGLNPEVINQIIQMAMSVGTLGVRMPTSSTVPSTISAYE